MQEFKYVDNKLYYGEKLILEDVTVEWLLYQPNVDMIQVKTGLESKEVLPALRKIKVTQFRVSECSSINICAVAISDGTIYLYDSVNDDWRWVYAAESHRTVDIESVIKQISRKIPKPISDKERLMLVTFCGGYCNRINYQRLSSRLTYNNEGRSLLLDKKSLLQLPVEDLDALDKIYSIHHLLKLKGIEVEVDGLKSILMKIKISYSIATYDDGDTKLYVTANRCLYRKTNDTSLKLVCNLGENLIFMDLVERIKDNVLDAESNEDKIDAFCENIFNALKFNTKFTELEMAIKSILPGSVSKFVTSEELIEIVKTKLRYEV